MGYAGSTYAIPLGQAGLNYNPNIDVIPFTSLIHPSRNINIHEGGVGKRGGTTKINDTAVSGGPRIVGLYDFLLYSGTQYQVFASSDGQLWKNTTTTINTGMSTSNKFSFANFKNTLFVADGATRPQTWNGAAASTSNITSIPTDWTGSNFPNQLIVHRKGLSKRLVGLVFSTTKETFYLSASDDANDFSNANVITMNCRTGDAHGIVGGATFGDRLIIFGKTQSFILDDTDASTANWGLSKAQWNAGVAHFRLIAQTPSDIICMMEDGTIYSVTAAQSYGDYKQANLTRPAFIDRWIREYVNLAYIEDFHCIYDPTMRAVKFFMVRNGQTEVDCALVYYIDRPVELAWAIHDNTSYASGYNASCAAIVRTAVGSYLVYTGDFDGFLWKLEQANKNDDSNGFWGGIRTPHVTFDNPRITKHFKRGWIITKPEGNYSLTVRWFVDSQEQTSTTVSLAGTGAIFGTGLFGTDSFGGQELIDSPYEFGQVGRRLQQELYNNVANQDFFISQLLVDFKPLGAKPA